MTIFLEDETTWPADVLDYLQNNSNVFLNWELRRVGKPAQSIDGAIFDKTVYGLKSILDRHKLHGYHCTRLTEPEIKRIEQRGMELPDASMLSDRIRMVQKSGFLTPSVVVQLLSRNQAAETNRAKKIWFCFYKPHFAGQHGIERFFRCWGGEALYNSHEHDPVIGPILGKIGVPCIIEARVPISILRKHSYLTEKIARRYLIERGFNSTECIFHIARLLRAACLSQRFQAPLAQMSV